MVRDLSKLTSRTFDVLVVGGGIYGLTIAYDAAQRGLSVALIEQDDFGSGSSFNHLRTIHGGLRYLQSLDFQRARESIHERRTLAQIAPHAVRPLSFALPLYPSLLKGRLATRVGLLVDRVLARDRNRGVAPALRLPAARILSRDEAAEHLPGLLHQGLTGAVVWHDYVTLESDRLTFAWASAGAAQGAALANHTEAVAVLRNGRRVVGVRAVDRHSGRELEVGARLTVNATGGGIDRLLSPLGTSAGIPLIKAMNLVTRREAGEQAIGGRAASGRHLFLVPWRKRALFGTWESPQPLQVNGGGVTGSEVSAFIQELNHAFPALELKREDVTLVHSGLVPASIARDGSVRLEPHEQIRDHAGDGIDGLLSVAGTKYTTARAVAERVTDDILRRLKMAQVPCRTRTTALPGGDLSDVPQAIAETTRTHGRTLPPDTIQHLVAAYGSRHTEILSLAASRPELAARIADEPPVIGAELVWAVREEMAVTLNDAVLRRTPLGAVGHPGDAAAARASEIVGAELGWSADRTREEIGALRAFYRIGEE